MLGRFGKECCDVRERGDVGIAVGKRVGMYF